MGCVQSYFRKAHNASLSPSSTQASENAGLIPESPTDPKKELLSDDDLKVVTSPPTTVEAITTPENEITVGNGVSKTGTGLGIVALAAATGTVAVLGTTANTTITDVLDEVEQVEEEMKKEAEMCVEDVEEIIEDANAALSSLTEDKVESPETKTSEPSSPKPGEENDEAEIQEDSVTTSPIPEDKDQPTSGKESSLLDTEKPESTPEPTKEDEGTESVTEVDAPVKELSRPTSAIVAEILTEKPAEDDDEPFPAPPPPEDKDLPLGVQSDNIIYTISESASPTSDSKAETETLSRNRRSITDLETPISASDTPISEEIDIRPASVVDIESKPQSRAENVVEPEIALEEEMKDASAQPSRLGSATAKEFNEDKIEGEQTPDNEVFEKSRPESTDAVVIEAAVDEVEEKIISEASEVMETISPVPQLINEPVVAEETTDTKEVETIEPEENTILAEDISKVEQLSAELAKNAATTIQATFRGHQARQTLRKIAGTPDAEENVAFDITPNLDEKSSEEEIKTETEQLPSSDDDLKEVTPPQLPDTDNDLVDSLTANDQKEDSAAPESIEELTSTDGKDEIPQIINVIINPERIESKTESLEEFDKISEDKSMEESTVPAESEAESIDVPLNDVDCRAASNISESSVSVGDSLSALRGSETESNASALLVSEELVAHVIDVAVEEVTNVENKKDAAATTIQATFRGFQERQKLQKAAADDTQLPVPEPLQDLLPEDQSAVDVDDDDLPPPPPEDCDIEPPPPEDQIDEAIASVLTDMVVTPRSPETGEKLNMDYASEQVSLVLDLAKREQLSEELDDLPPPIDPDSEEAVKLALLQRPQECDELPENRWETEDGEPKELTLDEEIPAETLSVLQKPQECDELPEHRGELANGDILSSAEVDDSSLSSAATKIQAGARGYLTRKHMKDTFSTTAPSITDSQQSVGAASTQEDDDGVQTSGSLETEVQRLSVEEPGNIGVTAVVISNINETLSNSLENGTNEITDVIKGKGLSLDSNLPQEKKSSLITTGSIQDPIVTAEEDQKVWQTLQNELEEAATKIQSNFRGFSTRQRLHRENAVHMPTISSADSSEKTENIPFLRSSGEFHDMMVLTPAVMLDETSVNDDVLANCQPSQSDLGTMLEGHVTVDDVTTSKSHTSVDLQKDIIKMGEATEAAPEKQVSPPPTLPTLPTPLDMKDDSIATAATKIQAGFRGYKVRKQMRQVHADGVKKNGPRSRRRSSHTVVVRHPSQGNVMKTVETTLQDRSATKIQAGIRGFLVRKRRREEKDAAVKIQAGFRGYKVRRDRKTRVPIEK